MITAKQIKDRMFLCEFMVFSMTVFNYDMKYVQSFVSFGYSLN